VLSIGFAALNINQPEDVYYQYRLHGFDDQWVTALPAQRTLVYSSLPNGEYTLEISAVSKNNLFERSSIQLPIVVLPAFWERPIFIATYILLFMVFVSGIVYYLSRRKLKARVRELETRERIQAERERISRDLHDSVGTHFAQIISKLDYLYLGWNRKEISDKQGYLGQVGEFARSGIRMLRETIWALDKSEVEVPSLRSKINEYLKLCFDHGQVKYDLDFWATPTKVNSTLALNCFRIIQERISNSLNHSGATSIKIVFHVFAEGNFRLTIEDNGHGFDIDTGKSNDGHYGLSNMEGRAKELGANFSILSTISGTVISIIKE
jgi:signal transduction histidine kinase